MPPLNPIRNGNEFPAGAADWPEDLDRRDFVKMMAASLALAGMTSCGKAPEKLVPYVTQPDSVIPGAVSHYASVFSSEGYARGVLVESHEGRPTKIEGNPRHSESLGGTDAPMQASILSLYDPDRSRTPLRGGIPASWQQFEGEWVSRLEKLEGSQGVGCAILTEPTTSPTLLRCLHGLLRRFPKSLWFQHTPLARYDSEGAQFDFNPSKADVIFAIESDFLGAHPACLRYSRAFAKRRRVINNLSESNRLYSIEGGLSLTGAMADHRLPAASPSLRRVLNAVGAALGISQRESMPEMEPAEKRFAEALSVDLLRNAPRVVVVVGPEQPESIKEWAVLVNRRLGAFGNGAWFSEAVRSDGDPLCAGTLGALRESLTSGGLHTVVILGTNPVYSGCADQPIKELLRTVEFSVHMGDYVDETSQHCLWHLPQSHFLEAWGDMRGYDGMAAIQQPLISPLFDTRSALELVDFLTTAKNSDGYDLVQRTWRGKFESDVASERWARWLNQGRIDDTWPKAKEVHVPGTLREFEFADGGSPLLVFRADPVVSDGRWANNGWLQELPRPFTTLVWDNALLVSPEFATEAGLRNGDELELAHSGLTLQAPVWVLPGMARDCFVLHLGGGRTAAGAVGNGRGVNAFSLRTDSHPWEVNLSSWRKTGKSVELVATQHHFEMEGRDLARTVTLSDLARNMPASGPASSLFPDWPKDRYAWGMSIDLSTCIGCSACVVACQAENNIPVVGKGQVAKGREMHWIRIDRYFSESHEGTRIVSQPVPCMQCENAPCELVCPVAATVHSSEGLNEMVYNRCVGTRYCSNNCPYKVRRFNFFDYRSSRNSLVHLQENPQVSIRERGVMEKCTYCVQRINAGRIVAEKENRPIRDGEIKTACQQACPVEAIVFGNIADSSSAVARRKKEVSGYVLLPELNTRPRTSYMPRVINPAKELSS